MRGAILQAMRPGLLALVIGLGGGLAGGLSGGAAAADVLPAPKGPVLLTVSGQIDCVNSADAAVLDQAILYAMGRDRIATSTIWTRGVHQFEGVSLASVLAALGAHGSTVRVTALNDYTISIPMDEITPRAPLLAVRMDGQALSPRDKGPVWAVYPFDEGGVFQHDVTYARAIWQLVRIEVLP